MWSVLQAILDFIIQNSDIIASVLAAAFGWKSGAFAWIIKKGIAWILKFTATEGKDLAQEQKDKGIAKEGEPLKPQIPAEVKPDVKEDIIKKRKSWFKRIIGGK